MAEDQINDEQLKNEKPAETQKAEVPQKQKSVWTEVVNQSLEQLKEKSKEMQSKLPGNSPVEKK